MLPTNSKLFILVQLLLFSYSSYPLIRIYIHSNHLVRDNRIVCNNITYTDTEEKIKNCRALNKNNNGQKFQKSS